MASTFINLAVKVYSLIILFWFSCLETTRYFYNLVVFQLILYLKTKSINFGRHI